MMNKIQLSKYKNQTKHKAENTTPKRFVLKFENCALKLLLYNENGRNIFLYISVIFQQRTYKTM